MTALSGGAPEQAPRWDLVDTESCGGGIRFLAPYLFVWGYVGIYRRKKYVGGASRGPRGRGRALRGGAPHPICGIEWWLWRRQKEGKIVSHQLGVSTGYGDAHQ